MPADLGVVSVAGTALASKAIEAMRHLGCDEVGSRFNMGKGSRDFLCGIRAPLPSAAES